VAWQDICTKFHRANHECEKECIKSDKYILEHLHEAKPAVSYLCPHGLTDNATPIIIDGTHLGNFFTGQFFLEKPDLSFFRKQAKKYGFDEEAYLEAVEKVPIWTREKLNQYLDFIKGFIEIIAGLGYKNLKEIETNKILKESELKYRSLIENSNDAVYCVDEKGEYKFTNRYFASIFDKTPEYFIGKTFWDILDKENADARYKVTKSVFKNALSESSEIEVRLSEKILNFWATSNPIRDETGKVILILTHATNITELKNTQKELEELIALNSNIINSARSGIIVYDDRLRYKIWNPFMEKLSGIPASKIVGRHPGEVFPFLEHTGVVANLEKVLKGENVDAIDFPFELPKIGKKGWTSDSNAALRNSDGKIIGVIGTVHDITDRKLREEEVEKARILAEENEIKARYLSIDLNKAQSVAKVGSWKWHINENRLDFSNEMFNIFGVEKDNFYGNLDEIIQWIHQEDMEKVVASKNSVIEKGIAVPIEFRILLPDNTIKFLWAEAGEMIYDKNDKPQVINGIVRDITEQRMKDRILHESEEKYSTLFHQTIDGIALHSLIFDEDNVLIDYVFIDVNEAFQNIINIRKEDVIGKKASQIIPPEELKKWLSIFAPVATNGASCRYENFSESNNKYFEGVAFSTKKNHFATIFRDVTENKLMELDLIRAKEKAEESDHLKTAFLRNMSHEVRTPLNAIAGFSSIIADKLYSDEKLQEYAKIITGNSDKLIGIITDVIEISQIQASQFKVNLTEIKLQAFIDKIVNPFYDRMKNINVQLYFKRRTLEMTQSSSLMYINWKEFYSMFLTMHLSLRIRDQ
jgi:PAS domain S-box-containing protein